MTNPQFHYGLDVIRNFFEHMEKHGYYIIGMEGVDGGEDYFFDSVDEAMKLISDLEIMNVYFLPARVLGAGNSRPRLRRWQVHLIPENGRDSICDWFLLEDDPGFDSAISAYLDLVKEEV